MNKNTTILPQEYQEIERYLLKEMTEQEMQSFSERLTTDHDLREKVHTVRLIIIGIQEDQLARELQKFHGGMKASSKDTTPKKNVFNLKTFLLAASVLIVAAIGSLLFFNSSKDERLYTEFYKPDSGLISSMSSSDEYVFDRAMIDYKTGNYTAAIKSWDSLLSKKPSNDTLQFFLGSAHLALDQNEEAIAYFEKVTTETDSYFLEDANWYMGLALIKVNKKDRAIPYIEKSDHPQKEKLLEKLRK